MFLAGEYPRDMDEESSRVKINALIHSGITVFIDLTDKYDNLLPYSYLLEAATHLRFPIRDTSIPDSTDVTVAILDTIDHHIGQGGMVYLHCWGGIGRTGTIVGCWLARNGFPGNAALARTLETLFQVHLSAVAGNKGAGTVHRRLEGNAMTSVQMRYQ